MSKQFPAEQFASGQVIGVRTAQPPRRGEYGRSFDLHPALYALTFGAYMAYVAIMGLAFGEANEDIAIPLVIFAVFIAAGFGTPALWARINTKAPGRPQSWARFQREGFECLTGHVSAKGAMVQVLIMPVLLLFWGVAVAIIAAAVR